MSLQVQFLPARQGDAIWVRWPGHQLLIDLGTEQTGRAFRERLTALPADQRRFDLLVITHVDSDHIGGVLSCFADADEELPGLSFGDVWFNGWEHLHGQQVAPRRGERALEGMGPAQGERLASWLRKQPWNEAFDRFPAACSEDALPTVHLPGGLALTVLGPTASRLAGLRQTWREEVEIALARGSLSEVSPGLGPRAGRTLEAYGSSRPPIRARAEPDPGPGRGSPGDRRRRPGRACRPDRRAPPAGHDPADTADLTRGTGRRHGPRARHDR